MRKDRLRQESARRIVVAAILSVLTSAAAVAFAEEFPAVEVYERISPSVVLIHAREKGKPVRQGAGSLVRRPGFILTSAHVVIDRESGKPYGSITVFVKPADLTGDFRKDVSLERSAPARIVAHDAGLDLALLEVSGKGFPAAPIALADPSQVRIGEEVVAIGHPAEGGLWSLTAGRISGQKANQENVAGRDVFQTDASINPGNSGGPLLDRRGYLVGINANIARIGAGNLPIMGINFAIKSSVARDWMTKVGYPVAYGERPLVPVREARIAAVPPAPNAAEQPPAAKESPSTKPAVPMLPASKDVLPPSTTPEPPAGEGARILTPKRPYDPAELVAAIEEALDRYIGMKEREMDQKTRWLEE